jgi:hypothetical protein
MKEINDVNVQSNRSASLAYIVGINKNNIHGAYGYERYESGSKGKWLNVG